MTMEPACTLANGQAVEVARVPRLAVADFRTALLAAVAEGRRIACLCGVPREDGGTRLWAVLTDDRQARLHLLACDPGGSYPALTPDCPQAHWFEREIWEQWGVRPAGHPWLKPLRFHAPYGQAAPGPPPAVGITDFFRVAGEEVHEVAVGPVHAGVIEPGHFRFQCHGEEVFHLEISLGYQHRGIERRLVGGPDRLTGHLVETLAGDSSVGHALAHAEVREALAGVRAPARAEALRGLALELERVANHVGDLGALAGDVGYLPTSSFCGRLRGDVLNLTALLCGNRFGRGLVRPGGMGYDLDPRLVATILARLAPLERDLTQAVELMWRVSSVMARFEGTGALSRETAVALGLVGPPARACGLERDVRQDFPAGIYRFAQLPVSSWDSGDVLARAQVRWQEVRRSLAFVRELLASLPAGETGQAPGPLAPGRVAVALVEGWRGEICHLALTDRQGRFAHYKVVDPSFHNWFGLAQALRGQAIADFPLCNKSFNLSYCGHDL